MLLFISFFKISCPMKQFFIIFMLALTATISTAQIVADAESNTYGVTTKALPKGRFNIFLFSTFRVEWKINGGVETAEGKYFSGSAEAREYNNFCPHPDRGQVLIIGIFDKWNGIISRKFYGFNSTTPKSFDLRDGYKFSAILRERAITDPVEK